MKSASQIQQLQSVELQLFELFAGAIRNHHMIDVGAHQGATLEPFVKAGWTVNAFEPIEANRNRMKERFSSCQTLIIHPEAVSNSSGYKDFHLALKKDGELHEYYHSLERIGLDSYHRKGRSIRIETVTLDDLIQAGRLSSKAGFLKVDAEGHDLAVLQGASLVEADVISVEFWGHQHPLGKSPSPLAEMAALLDARGYRTFIVLCRQGEGIEYLDSVSWVPPDSWGNAIFFREEQSALGRQCAELLRTSSFASTRVGRLPKIIRNSLPRTAFTFVDVGAYLGDFSQDVLEDFPSATGWLFEPTD
ncbi:MAG: FkbM family methyltransferase, partial [Terriglobia bacterium]